jgi:hypothetical protein
METPNSMKEIQRMPRLGHRFPRFLAIFLRLCFQAKEAATSAKPLTQIQKTNPATAEKLKAFLTTKALDESKVVFLPSHLTRSTRNEDMTVVLDKETGKIVAIAPVPPPLL